MNNEYKTGEHSPNDPKLSHGGGWRTACAGWWAKAAGWLSRLCDSRSRWLQRMVRRLRLNARRLRRKFIVRVGRELVAADSTGLYGARLTDETIRVRQLKQMLRTQERGWPRRDRK